MNDSNEEEIISGQIDDPKEEEFIKLPLKKMNSKVMFT